MKTPLFAAIWGRPEQSRRSHRSRWLAGGLLALLLAGGSVLLARAGQFGDFPLVGFNAPELPPPGENVSGTTWINSPPLTMKQLRGKVVMIDFWEYTCINCIRTFDQTKDWYKRYHQYGFEVIGVHDPEFDIAYPVANVRTAVKRFQLPWPIVVDDWFTIWKSYHNSTWPHRFLIDATGKIRFDVSGEGQDRAFEEAIQYLLQKAHPGLKFPASDTLPPELSPFRPACGMPTEEMYVGNWYDRGVLQGRPGYHNGKTLEYTLPKKVGDGRAGLSGLWGTDKNGMIYRGKGQPSSDRLVMRYHAAELYSVLNVSRSHPGLLYIRQDGRDLTRENAGVDVKFDPNGHSFIEVNEPRMYYLVSNKQFGSHEVELLPTAPGLAVNSFTFGNSCQEAFSHL